MKATPSGSGLTQGGAAPPILTRALDGRIVILACPFDVIAAMDRGFIWNRMGFLPESTAALLDNILLWRLATRPLPGGGPADESSSSP